MAVKGTTPEEERVRIKSDKTYFTRLPLSHSKFWLVTLQVKILVAASGYTNTSPTGLNATPPLTPYASGQDNAGQDIQQQHNKKLQVANGDEVLTLYL